MQIAVKNAYWEIEMKNGWITLKLDGRLMASSDDLKSILVFIEKWHEEVVLES